MAAPARSTPRTSCSGAGEHRNLIDERGKLSETLRAELRSSPNTSNVARTLNRGESVEFDEAMEKKRGSPACAR